MFERFDYTATEWGSRRCVRRSCEVRDCGQSMFTLELEAWHLAHEEARGWFGHARFDLVSVRE